MMQTDKNKQTRGETDTHRRSTAGKVPERFSWREVMLFSLAFGVALLVAGVGFHVVSRAQASDVQEETVVAPQIPFVEVITLQEEPVRHWVEFSGRMQSVDFVEIRPRVSGTIQKVLFKEGAIIKTGAPLFVIDPRPFEAALALAQAQLASAKSEMQLAKTELGRNKNLIKKKLISESRYDSSHNTFNVTLAAVDAAKATLKQAGLNLEYAHITAPVSGRISRAEITAGNVIEAGPNAPVLATIVSDDKLYAEFDVDEQIYVKTVRQLADSAPLIELKLQGDKRIVYQGALHSFDNRIDTESGTIRARAIFENTDGTLLDGMYAKVRFGSVEKQAALLIPERAIGTNQDQKFVYTISQDNEVEYRVVKPGHNIEGRRVILSGLKPGEQVVVNGLHRMYPKLVVEPVDISAKNKEDNVRAKMAFND